MVAASRSPRLSPCAPIGGITCAASPTRTMRFWPKRRAISERQRKDPAAGFDRDLAKERVRSPFDLRGELGIGKRREAGRLGRVDHEDQARALAGQRHQRERTGFGVEFGRGVAMRPRMREIEGERGLRIAPACRFRSPRPARQSERRPSAPTASRAVTSSAVAERNRRCRESPTVTCSALAAISRSAGTSRARASSAASRCRFSML